MISNLENLTKNKSSTQNRANHRWLINYFVCGIGESGVGRPSRRWESQELLKISPNANRTQHVQKRHGAISHIIPAQAPVANLHKWNFSHDFALK